jgi:hypothetical protein
MIVAIVNQTTPAGSVRVKEFREASDEATALADFLAAPPVGKVPADWLGYDSNFGASYVYPPEGSSWTYDFDLVSPPPGARLVSAPNTAQIEAQIKEQLLADPLSGRTVTAVATGLSVKVDIQDLVFGDVTVVAADPTDTKFLRISYVYNSATDTFAVEAYEKTTGMYALYEPPQYLVRELGEWFVVAGGTALVEV